MLGDMLIRLVEAAGNDHRRNEAGVVLRQALVRHQTDFHLQALGSPKTISLTTRGQASASIHIFIYIFTFHCWTGRAASIGRPLDPSVTAGALSAQQQFADSGL
jgi:hypothetical protein